MKGRHVKLADDDLCNRRPVWQAMSDLFLDTELQEPNLVDIATTLAQSPYSLDELESILHREVYPVLVGNLWYGEWHGIDPGWLEGEILKHIRRKWSFANLFQLNRWLIRDDWDRVKQHIAEYNRLA